MANNNNQRTMTSTQIRNLYSDGMSSMNIKFFNTNLSFQLYPFKGKDQTGKSSYDTTGGHLTTVNFEGAFALYKTAEDIIDGKIQECDLPIPCAAGASITLKRQPGPNGVMETFFNITKNGSTIEFKFNTLQYSVKENGQYIQKTLEVGLGAFKETIKGYLNGINADRHLDKLTEEYAKIQQQGNIQYTNNQNNQNNYNNNKGGYNKKKYNNYNKPYNNNYNNNQQNGGWNNNQPQQQDMSSYQIQN